MLFPGFDGTARTLADELEQHCAFNPQKFEGVDLYETEFDQLKQRRLQSSA
jgi:hypothetical protein